MAEEEAGSGYLSGILNGIWSGKYSQTSRKPPPKMSSEGGCLREVVAYESLDHK